MKRFIRLCAVLLYSFLVFSCAFEDDEITGSVVVDVDSSAMTSQRTAGGDELKYFFTAALINVRTNEEKVFSGSYSSESYKTIKSIQFEDITGGNYRIKASLKNGGSVIYTGETGVFTINWHKSEKANIALKMQLASVIASSWSLLQEYINSASGYREIMLEGESLENQNEINVDMNSENTESDPKKIIIGSGKTIKIYSVQDFEIIAKRNNGKATTLFEVENGGKLIIGDENKFTLTSRPDAAASGEVMANSALINVCSGGTLELKNVVIQGCAQYNSGAAVVAMEGSSIKAVSSEFNNNKVTKFTNDSGSEEGSSAGAIFIDGNGTAVSSQVKFEGCEFTANVGKCGSVVTTKGYDVIFDECTMKGNGNSESTSAVNACAGNVVLKSLVMESNQGTSNYCRDIQVGTDGEGSGLLIAKVTLKGTLNGSSTNGNGDNDLYVQYYNNIGAPVLIFDEDFVYQSKESGKIKLYETLTPAENDLGEIYFKSASAIENSLELIDIPKGKTLVTDTSTGKLLLQ